MTLKEFINASGGSAKAIGHFNAGELSGLKAIMSVARKQSVPVIIGTSEGERDFMGLKNAVAMVRAACEEYGIPVFLNADHTHSYEKIVQAVEAGYDAVLFDGGKLPWEENIRETRRVVKYVKSVNPEIIVEGELGYIGSASEIREELPPGAAINPEDFTSPEQAEEFVNTTGVDMLAPAVGNIHGMFANAPEPRLDIARIKAIKEKIKIPLVLHGASGNTDEDIRAAIKAGIVIVHFSTELRIAWRRGLEAGLAAAPKEVAPHKLLGAAITSMEGIVLQKLQLFQG